LAKYNALRSSYAEQVSIITLRGTNGPPYISVLSVLL